MCFNKEFTSFVPNRSFPVRGRSARRPACDRALVALVPGIGTLLQVVGGAAHEQHGGRQVENRRRDAQSYLGHCGDAGKLAAGVSLLPLALVSFPLCLNNTRNREAPCVFFFYDVPVHMGRPVSTRVGCCRALCSGERPRAFARSLRRCNVDSANTAAERTSCGGRMPRGC